MARSPSLINLTDWLTANPAISSLWNRVFDPAHFRSDCSRDTLKAPRYASLAIANRFGMLPINRICRS
ncbi:MAG TPA: hypothetical protein VF023_09855, partial [Bryobacteraceae bacterium]